MSRIALLAPFVLLALGCGSDFTPPELETTGVPAAPVGQVLDLEVDLPHLDIQNAMFDGVRLELRIEMERGGFGEIPARVVYEKAVAGLETVEIEDLSNGRTEILVTTERWFSGRLGPLRIGTAVFEIMLDGTEADDGWSVSGRSWESLSALFGTFDGWRRHRFLVAGTDFFSDVGRIAEVALVKERELRVRPALEFVSSDPTLRVSQSGVFAVNRLTFDNLQRLDPQNDFATAWQAGVGSGANPHDIAFVSESKLYVTRYEPPFDDVAILDPARGVVRSIPLGELAENVDGTPRPDRMRLVGTDLFVGLQDIDRSFSRFSEGKLAVIDTTTDTVVGVVPLGGKNPGGLELLRTGERGREKLYVVLSGIYPGLQPQELSGGIAVVDVTSRTFERMALDDDAVGGNVAALALVSETLGYVVVSDEAFVNRVVAFDPATATPLREVWSTMDFLPELEADTGGVLAIPNRSFFTPELCLYRVPASSDATEIPLGCASLQLPPFSVEALD